MCNCVFSVSLDDALQLLYNFSRAEWTWLDGNYCKCANTTFGPLDFWCHAFEVYSVPRENALDTDCRPIIRYHYSTLQNYNHIKSGFATHYEHNPTLNLSNIYNYFQFSEVYLFLIRFFCIPTYVASFINRPFSRVLSIIPPQKICRQKNIPPKIFRQFLPADNSFPEKEWFWAR